MLRRVCPSKVTSAFTARAMPAATASAAAAAGLLRTRKMHQSASFDTTKDVTAAAASAATSKIEPLPVWICNGCHAYNFSDHQHCYHCNEAHPKINDPHYKLPPHLEADRRAVTCWNCPHCHTLNSRGMHGTSCSLCHCPRPRHFASLEAEMGLGAEKAEGSAKSDCLPPWTCKGCDKRNFADRPTCYNCNESHPELCGAVKPMQKQMPASWNCPHCRVPNVASNAFCNFCTCPKPSHYLNDA